MAEMYRDLIVRFVTGVIDYAGFRDEHVRFVDDAVTEDLWDRVEGLCADFDFLRAFSEYSLKHRLVVLLSERYPREAKWIPFDLSTGTVSACPCDFVVWN